jgi:hypothetical protein
MGVKAINITNDAIVSFIESLGPKYEGYIKEIKDLTTENFETCNYFIITYYI